MCFDESPKQAMGEVREPLPVEPGESARRDTEYRRHAVRDLMMIREPRQGWRDVSGHGAAYQSSSTTPQHGSRLDIAEIELVVLSDRRLSQRIPDEDSLRKQVAANIQ
jgi:hypothetical protein